MFKERARGLQGVLLSLDAVCIAIAFGIALMLRVFTEAVPVLRAFPIVPWEPEGFVRSDYAVLFAVNLVAWIVYIRRSGLYVSRDAGRLSGVLPVFVKGLLLCILATSVVSFALKVSVSRLLFAYFFFIGFLLLLLKQVVIVAAVRRLRRDRVNRRHALVIGAGRSGSWLCDVVDDAGDAGYTLTGLVVPNGGPPPPSVKRVLGRVADLDEILRNHEVDSVFIVGSARELSELAPVAQDLIQKGRLVSLVSTLNGSESGVCGRVTHFNGVPMLSFGPMPHDEVERGTRRFIDIAVSAVALVTLWPLMLAVTTAIKLFDPGPVLFKQQRLGLGGKRFNLFKFRSMRVDAEKILGASPEMYARYVANDYKLPEDEDPRISALGRFLRRSSLDELPQLWNILRGEMSLVGPRPIVPTEIAKYEPYSELLLTVRPGLTGQWQVSGRNDVRYPERAFMDLDYVGNHQLTEDLAIVLRTVPAVLRRRGMS